VPRRQILIGCIAAAAGVAAVTGFLYLAPAAARLSNSSFLYLLVVIGVAYRYGSRPAVLASLLGFLAYDWWLVTPRYHFTVHEPEEWLALGMFLLTAIVTGQLTVHLQQRAEEARQHAREFAALAEASWAVASQASSDAALFEVLRQLGEVLDPELAAIVVPEEGTALETVAWFGEQPEDRARLSEERTREAIRLVLARGQPLGWESPGPPAAPAVTAGDSEAPGATAAYLPLAVEGRVLGVLYLRLRPEQRVTPEERRLIESVANHAAVVLERDRATRGEARARALAEADRFKSALLSMVSHNFRSPLASIKASVGGLRNPDIGDAATRDELLKGIDQETDRLNRMVANILTVSRLKAGDGLAQCEPTSIRELVGAVFDSLRADEKQRLQVTLDPNLPEVCLDPVQIAEALFNLVDNALRYSPPESPVELEASRHGGAVVLEVLDRGPGLPAGDEERMFDPWYRMPGNQESARRGIGLGLPVSRGLVEAHGGHLNARNRKGGGAVFQITLPRQDAGVE
jgi:two-component system sensor histidine kinase KdpD